METYETYESDDPSFASQFGKTVAINAGAAAGAVGGFYLALSVIGWWVMDRRAKKIETEIDPTEEA